MESNSRPVASIFCSDFNDRKKLWGNLKKDRQKMFLLKSMTKLEALAVVKGPTITKFNMLFFVFIVQRRRCAGE